MPSNEHLAQTPPRREKSQVVTWVAAGATVIASLALVMAVAATVFLTGAHYGNRWKDEYDAEEYFGTDYVGGCMIGLNCGCIGPMCHYELRHP
jgi:hypothetical protein